MSDLPEDTWMKSRPVTHQDLTDESAAVLEVLRKEHALEMDRVRDQLNHLQKTHTVALMAAELYGTWPFIGGCAMNMDLAAQSAKKLYREVQKTLEIDQQITGRIPAA